MESVVEDLFVLIVLIVRYLKNLIIKWDLNVKKLVFGKFYGKRIRKFLNGYYIVRKSLYMLFGIFFDGYFNLCILLIICLNI